MELFDVTSVQALPQRCLALSFEDGTHGEIALDSIIQGYTGIFLPLLDEQIFAQVTVSPDLGTLVWPNGADLCPQVLYRHVQARNTGSAE